MKTEGWEDKGTQGAHEAWAASLTNEEALATLTAWARHAQALDQQNEETISREEYRRLEPPADREEARRYRMAYNQAKMARLFAEHKGHNFWIASNGTVTCDGCEVVR